MVKNYSRIQEKEWDKLVNEFQSRSDRSVAILGTVYLDTYLGQLLSGFFVDSADTASRLLGKEYPLGNFSARIKAAYCLGLLSKHEYHDLSLILEVRNSFIADVEVASFASDGIREYCYQFKIARDILLPGETRTPRRLFVFTCTLLIQHLALRTEMAIKERCTTPNEFRLVDTDH